MAEPGIRSVQRFPSSRQFMKVVADPRRLKGHEDHRDPAMADTYTSFAACSTPCANAEPANRHVRVLVCPGFGRAQPPIG